MTEKSFSPPAPQWRSVPVEPTMGMYDDFYTAMDRGEKCPMFGRFRAAYTAMLNAAPRSEIVAQKDPRASAGNGGEDAATTPSKEGPARERCQPEAHQIVSAVLCSEYENGTVKQAFDAVRAEAYEALERESAALRTELAAMTICYKGAFAAQGETERQLKAEKEQSACYLANWKATEEGYNKVDARRIEAERQLAEAQGLLRTCRMAFINGTTDGNVSIVAMLDAALKGEKNG